MVVNQIVIVRIFNIKLISNFVMDLSKVVCHIFNRRRPICSNMKSFYRFFFFLSVYFSLDLSTPIISHYMILHYDAVHK
jgi:hypothetical protein